MPNHVENDFIVTGPIKDVVQFMRDMNIDGILFNFSNAIPYPPEYHEADKKVEEWREQNPGKFFAPFKDGYNNGGYEWRRDNWGTKWNAYDCTLNKETDLNKVIEEIKFDYGDDFENEISNLSVEYYFQTAWSPPRKVIEVLSSKYPTLTFEHHFFEQGMGYMGIDIYKNGALDTTFKCEYHGSRGG